MKGLKWAICVMCIVFYIFHLYTEHLTLLRQCIILWIILRYDYLGNLWYGIIALNGIFIKKLAFLRQHLVGLQTWCVVVQTALEFLGSPSLNFGLIGLDHHAWSYLGNLKYSVQIFISCKHSSWILYLLILYSYLLHTYKGT